MPETMTAASWWHEIRRRTRERDMQRLVWQNRTRKATLAAYLGARARARVPALLPEFVKAMLGAALGFWLLAGALAWLFDARPLYTYVVLAIVFALQATYYKRQLARDPEFRVRRCHCAGARRDNTETVLKSSASTILGVPNSVWAVALYSALLVLLHGGYARAALLVAGVAVLASGYFGYVMIARVKGLCSTCVNIAGLNCLILWQLLPVLRAG